MRLLIDATQNYPAWLTAIASARHHIQFKSYIIHEDSVGFEFADALIAKAQQGVRVRLIYDWMGGFTKDKSAQEALAHTPKLAEMKSEDFDTVFYVGGHGPIWDLAESPTSIALLESFYNAGKTISLVCHSPGVLRHVTYKGEPLVKGKRVTGSRMRRKRK